MGSEKGLLRVWEVGKWDGEPERINVGGRDGEGADILCTMPEELSSRLDMPERAILAGMGDGSINIVRLGKGKGKVVGDIRHHEVEPVGGLDFEAGGRLVSGGGDVVKVWEQATTCGAQDEDLRGPIEGEDEDIGEEADDSGDEEDSSCDEEEKQKKRKKRRKRGKAKAKNTGKGIMGFRGMD